MATLRHYMQSAGFWMLLAYVIGAMTFLYLRHQDRVQTDQIKAQTFQIKAQAHANCVGQNDVRMAISNILRKARDGALNSQSLSEERKARAREFYDEALAELKPREC